MEVLRFSWGVVSAVTFQLEGFRFEPAEVLLSVCLPSVSLHGFSISALFSSQSLEAKFCFCLATWHICIGFILGW